MQPEQLTTLPKNETPKSFSGGFRGTLLSQAGKIARVFMLGCVLIPLALTSLRCNVISGLPFFQADNGPKETAPFENDCFKLTEGSLSQEVLTEVCKAYTPPLCEKVGQAEVRALPKEKLQKVYGSNDYIVSGFYKDGIINVGDYFSKEYTKDTLAHEYTHLEFTKCNIDDEIGTDHFSTEIINPVQGFNNYSEKGVFCGYVKEPFKGAQGNEYKAKELICANGVQEYATTFYVNLKMPENNGTSYESDKMLGVLNKIPGVKLTDLELKSKYVQAYMENNHFWANFTRAVAGPNNPELEIAISNELTKFMLQNSTVFREQSIDGIKAVDKGFLLYSFNKDNKFNIVELLPEYNHWGLYRTEIGNLTGLGSYRVQCTEKTYYTLFGYKTIEELRNANPPGKGVEYKPTEIMTKSVEDMCNKLVARDLQMTKLTPTPTPSPTNVPSPIPTPTPVR